MDVLQERLEIWVFSNLWVRNRKRDSARNCDDLDIVVLRLDLPARQKWMVNIDLHRVCCEMSDVSGRGWVVVEENIRGIYSEPFLKSWRC
jgi:hypothetical protein